MLCKNTFVASSVYRENHLDVLGFFFFLLCSFKNYTTVVLHNTVAEKPVVFCRKANDPWQLVSQMRDYRIVSSAPDSANLEYLDADVKCVVVKQ